MTLDEAVDALAPRLLRYCRAKTSGRFSLAEEIAQESLAALVQHWRRYGPPASPEAFVFAIARRRAWRAGLRHRLLLPLERLTNHADQTPDPERQAIAREACDHVFRALGRLPRGEREALLLTVVGELDNDAAALTLKITTAATKMRVMRAKKRLARLVEDDRQRSESKRD